MGKNIENFILEVYKDVASPTAKRLGITIDEVAKLILNPIRFSSQNLNKRIEKWFERIENEVPEENRVDAKPNIVIPALQGLAINPDESVLGEMFFNILKSSIDKEKQKFLSPAFPKILEQLTRDEAVFLFFLKKCNYKISFRASFDEETGFLGKKTIIENEFPIEKLDFKENLWLYNDHLKSFNLSDCFECSRETISTDAIFGFIKISDLNLPTNIEIVVFSEFRLTDFGKSFAEVCISEECEKFVDTTNPS